MKSLLILGCSATKRPDPGLLPALDRYDGPLWRVLRGALKRHPGLLGDRLTVAVLSAKHGLIDIHAQIADYNQPMTQQRASELAPQVQLLARGAVERGGHWEVLVCAGKLYRQLLEPALDGAAIPVRYTAGGIGQHQQQLYRWLEAL